MRTFALVLLLVAWFGVGNSAKAETISATGSTAPTAGFSANGKFGTSIADVCAANSPYQGYTLANYQQNWCSTNPGGGPVYTVESGYYCLPSLTNVGVSGVCAASYSCPSGGGWTLSGSTCTRPDCVAPQTRNSSGACEVICPAAGSNAMIGGAQAWGVTGSSATCIAGISFGGCKIACTAGVSASGKASCTGCTFTGVMSAPGDVVGDPTTGEEIKAPTKPEECLAKGMGYVTTSGGTACVASSDSPNSVKSTEVTKTTNTGTGAGSSETVTECEGGNCTSTTTKKDAGGAVTGTTTETGADPASKEKDPETDCEKFPNSAGCLELGAPPTGDEVGTKAIESVITPVSMGSSTCPSDVSLPKGAKFSWAPVCDFATSLRPVIIALAWLAAAFIVLGFSRGN